MARAVVRRSSRLERHSPRKEDAGSLCSVGSAPSMTFSRTVNPAQSPTPCSVRAIPNAGQVVGMVSAELAPAVGEVTRRRVHEPADHVEKRRLAGAVRADDPDHFSRPDGHGDLVEREDPSEADGDVVNGEYCGTVERVVDGILRGREDRAHRWAYSGTEGVGARSGRGPQACMPTSPPASRRTLQASQRKRMKTARMRRNGSGAPAGWKRSVRASDPGRQIP